MENSTEASPESDMAPRNTEFVPTIDGETVHNEVEPVVTAETHEAKRPAVQVVWRNVAMMGYVHLAAVYGLVCAYWAHPLTWLWAFIAYWMNAFGITAGAHRLWAHRSYKAKLPFRIMLAVFNSMAAQNDIIEWSRDHRVHHKFSETDADPHNAKRGFFFAHVGWLLCRKHPDVKSKGSSLDISDLLADPVCAFQRKVYLPSVALCCFILPAIVPWYFWGESFWTAFFFCSVFRYALCLNVTWCVNSAAHMWGNKPYDRHINPAENFLVAAGSLGEGYHNFHHTFPYDYQTSEFGWKWNPTSLLLDIGAALGQVYNRKTVSREAIQRKMQRSGDGTRYFGYGQQRKED